MRGVFRNLAFIPLMAGAFSKSLAMLEALPLLGIGHRREPDFIPPPGRSKGRAPRRHGAKLRSNRLHVSKRVRRKHRKAA